MKNMNLNEMSYNELVAKNAETQKAIEELVAKRVEYQKAINRKREASIKEAIRVCMDTYGVTKEEMMSILEGEDSINLATTQEVDDLTETVVLPEAKENNGVEPLALPDPQEETKVETKPTSVFDLPALQEDYNPLKTKETVLTPEPKKDSPVEKIDDNIPSMESLLCDDPNYQGFYHPDTPKRKNNRGLPAMEELLSGEPVNRILNLGNLNPKGAPYRQHSRVNHVDGIIPTETATGKTLVYIPS